MDFLYGASFLSQSPEAYERLLLDAMRGDATLFTRKDEVEAQWRICDPILEAWSRTTARCRSTPPARDHVEHARGDVAGVFGVALGKQPRSAASIAPGVVPCALQTASRRPP